MADNVTDEQGNKHDWQEFYRDDYVYDGFEPNSVYTVADLLRELEVWHVEDNRI